MANPMGGGAPSFMSGLPAAPAAPPAADPLSLLQMAQTAMGTGDNPYGGRTLAQTVIGGLPYGMNVGADGRPMGDGGGGGFGNGFDANAWLDRPATNENVSDAIQRGGQYRPEVARTLQSSGAEGGFFSIPGQEATSQIPWGYYPANPEDNAASGGGAGGPQPRSSNRGNDNPAPGLFGMSTNNWRLLPYQFRDPRWAMRAGHIIDRSTATNPGVYVAQQTQALHLGYGGHGFPLSFGRSFGPRQSFFPGQIEPWIPEGGPGGMGTGIY